MQQDAFSDFRTAITRHFRPVAADLGLGQATERVLYPEIYITFATEARRLVVSFELGAGPWVEVQISDRGREHGFGLHTLEEDVEGASNFTQAVSALQTVDEQVHALADLTRRYAAALLKGDLGRVRTLKLLRAKARRQRNFEMFGTRSGVTPLDHRPTLLELFANARKAEFPADALMFSVYQAAWDHDYAVDEIARFLRVAPVEIQRIIDALDNVSDDPPDLNALRKILGSG